MLIYIFGFVCACIITFICTPWVKKLATTLGVVDHPNPRKVHRTPIPRLGGLAIFIGFVVAYLLLVHIDQRSAAILIGGLIIVLVGFIDDKYQLSPKAKIAGQLLASITVVGFGIKIDIIQIPFGEIVWDVGWLSIPITIFWIVGVTNAVNLIDGLDGLATGVSGIAASAILVMAVLMGNEFVVLTSSILLGSIIAFLYYNFYPAKIFMGDSGAMFLGFMLSVLSLLGFKQVTVVSYLVPVVLLGVPLTDTFFAIIRRIVNRQPITAPDKNHLHHCLMALGFNHRKTVMMIYGIGLVFGVSAIFVSQSGLWQAIFVLIALMICLQIGAEAIGLVNTQIRPVFAVITKAKIWYNKISSKVPS